MTAIAQFVAAPSLGVDTECRYNGVVYKPTAGTSFQIVGAGAPPNFCEGVSSDFTYLSFAVYSDTGVQPTDWGSDGGTVIDAATLAGAGINPTTAFIPGAPLGCVLLAFFIPSDSGGIYTIASPSSGESITLEVKWTGVELRTTGATFNVVDSGYTYVNPVSGTWSTTGAAMGLTPGSGYDSGTREPSTTVLASVPSIGLGDWTSNPAQIEIDAGVGTYSGPFVSQDGYSWEISNDATFDAVSGINTINNSLASFSDVGTASASVYVLLSSEDGTLSSSGGFNHPLAPGEPRFPQARSPWVIFEWRVKPYSAPTPPTPDAPGFLLPLTPDIVSQYPRIAPPVLAEPFYLANHSMPLNAKAKK